jgi:hypothetical protein
MYIAMAPIATPDSSMASSLAISPVRERTRMFNAFSNCRRLRFISHPAITASSYKKSGIHL